MNSTGDLKRFYQGLIQAAVGLLHFCNGNLSGARKLYHSSRDKMRDLPSPYLGLDLPQFWQAMEQCFRELLEHDSSRPIPQPQDDLLPVIQITPPPEQLPNPQDLIKKD